MTTIPLKKPAADRTHRLPAVQTGQALLSLRDSGFSLPTALAEVIDNSIEANARHIRLDLRETTKGGKKLVHEIAASDDGDGMDLDTLWHYPVVGFSTRYMRTDTIGKYGVGAKLAALNFGRRLDVWSRQSASGPWMHVYFDLDEALDEERNGVGHAGIAAPSETPVPAELEGLLPAEKGTLVLWSKVDRLEEGRMAPDYNGLVQDVVKEIARVFREFINAGIRIEVNGQNLLPHDPLFLMSDTWADAVLTRVMRKDNPNSKVQHFPAELIWEEPVKVGGSTATIRITLYPLEATQKRGQGDSPLAKELRIPENEGSISFMRRGREIAYTNVPRIFPRGVKEPDRYFGIEVSFNPDLDAYFGVRNVKRGVEPHGELRDKIREVLKRYLAQARKKLDERWGAVARKEQEHTGEHGAILTAAAKVAPLLPGSRVPPAAEHRVRVELEDLARDTGHDESKEELESYIERVRDLPYVLESVDFPGKQFIDVRLLGNKVIIRLNTRHRFYRELWQPLSEIAGMDAGAVSGDDAVKAARRAVEGLTLMVLAYGKALSMTSEPDEFDDFTADWGRFIDTLMGRVKDVI